MGTIHRGTLFSDKNEMLPFAEKWKESETMRWNEIKQAQKDKYLICTHCRIYIQHTWYESSKWVFSRGKGQREGRKDQGRITGRKNEINIVCSLSYVELRLKNTHMYVCIYMYMHMHTLIYWHTAYERRKGTIWGNAGDQRD